MIFDAPGAEAVDEERRALCGFLVHRLEEELACLWDREHRRGGPDPERPGLPAKVAVVHELMEGLRAGVLPDGFTMRILLHGYCHHPEYDPDRARLTWQGSPHGIGERLR